MPLAAVFIPLPPHEQVTQFCAGASVCDKGELVSSGGIALFVRQFPAPGMHLGSMNGRDCGALHVPRLTCIFLQSLFLLITYASPRSSIKIRNKTLNTA